MTAAVRHELGGFTPRVVVQRAPSVLVMLPALNEEATIGSVISRIPRTVEGCARVDVLVIDDGSTDATAEIARAAGAAVISHGYNRGVGAALHTAIEEAIARRADIAVNMDSDGQFDPAHIPALIGPVMSGAADMATASRFKDPSLVPQMPASKLFGNHAMSWLLSWLVGERFSDVSCGFRAYSREALLRLVLTGAFTYTQESFLVLASKGLRITEVPLKVRGVREHGESRVASSLLKYASRTSAIIFGSVRDYRPGSLFNSAALVLFLASLAFGAFFVGHRLTAGQFTPHIWAGFVSAFLFGLAMIVFAMGQVALMVARIRKVQDEQLYLMRKLSSREREAHDRM